MPILSRRIATTASLVLLVPAVSFAQQAISPSVGTYVGQDSLDASRETGTSSRRLAATTGAATWAIELDSLDLRRKFTIRIEVATPARMTIVLRLADSLPPRPGRYLTMIPSTGASHSRPREIHGDIDAVEQGRPRHYGSFVDTVTITRVETRGGQPIVEGTLKSLASRYADGPKGTLVFDNVWLRMQGQFSARPARDARPTVVVTASMQEKVLRRALDGFLITSMGAINGDGDADSTHDAARARAFLESRWHESAIIERLSVDRRRFAVTLRGRFVPVLCEATSDEEPADCTTLPPTVVQSGRVAPARLEGRFVHASVGSPAAQRVTTVHLLPNPVPLKDAFEKLCTVEDSIMKVAERDIIPAIFAIKDSVKVDSAASQFMRNNRSAYEKRYRALFESFAVRHAPIAADGRFAFAEVPAGNYLLFVWVPEDSERIEWYLPVTVQGTPVHLDVDRSNVSNGNWYCGTRMPFSAVRAARR